jgi:(1->4)-alpha-D-glucan 1-alpha-D-glucosylmutase
MSGRAITGTYRLQFNEDFPLEHATGIVQYLHRLGVSHVYASPLLAARTGSTHGYDVADPTKLNPRLGTEQDREKLVSTLHDAGMGLVLDIVPNHMGTGPDNPYWEDILANGRKSCWAHWFDVEWDEQGGKILLPVLGDKLEEVLSRNELEVRQPEGCGPARLHYFETSFPLNEASVSKGEWTKTDGGSAKGGEQDEGAHSGAGSSESLASLLEAQHYRLTSWRDAATHINYRRFFDINELIALRAEDIRVRKETHGLVLKWVGEGMLDGLRVDHVDGLLDPAAYLEWLRTEVQQRAQGKSTGRFPIFVEKILTGEERLRKSWPVQGTTGYEFMNELEALFVHAAGFELIEERYRRLRTRGKTPSFHEIARAGKLSILNSSLNADVRRLARLLRPIAKREAAIAEASEKELTTAIVELLAALPVYRTYADPESEEISPEDLDVLRVAIGSARERDVANPAILAHLHEILSLKALKNAAGSDRKELIRFVQRFQQTSGPATAKGVEDTALYLYYPLGSFNEVGGEPTRELETATAKLHEANAERARDWPRNILSTNTHDTKRSADVRARLDVLSEMPRIWWSRVSRWRMLNRPHRQLIGRRYSPDPNTEYLLYQSLVGIWPLMDARAHGKGALPGRDEIEELRTRLDAYMQKAVREGKSRSSWTDPDEKFEESLSEFIRAILERSPSFLADLAPFVSRIALPGLWNSLSRTLVHLTAPGVPDLYQGDELWNFSLVDPDNRRPVDYDTRSEMLERLEARFADEEGREDFIDGMVHRPHDGRIKLHLIHRVLGLRRELASLFSEGSYLPLATEGPAEGHVFSFAREHQGKAAVTIVPRLAATLTRNGDAPVGMDTWNYTVISLPKRLQGARWRDAITGLPVDPASPLESEKLLVGAALGNFPVALLVTE